MVQGTLPGIEPPTPRDDDDWFAKWIEVSDLFSPNHPVLESELFSGRRGERARIVDAVFQRGQHVVVHGDRGVGKTSLINVVLKQIHANKPSIKIFPAQCFSGEDFVDIWLRVFKDQRWPNGEYAVDDIDDTVGPNELYDLASRFNPNESPIFSFDEFDRITDQDTKIKMAETIKLFSDRSSSATIIVSGVGRMIRDLISEHESIRRSLRQVEMPRMSPVEIMEIVSVRIRLIGMEIAPEALELIVWLSHGMPGYAHLLGKYSAKSAIYHKSLRIDVPTILESLDECLDETFESTRQAYSKATQSSKPNNRLRESLLACATAPHSEFGAFTAADVVKPLSNILHKERSIPDFNRHLKAFCAENRGPILEREGSARNFQYRFIDPMMQSYVITKGVKDGLLATNQE